MLFYSSFPFRTGSEVKVWRLIKTYRQKHQKPARETLTNGFLSEPIPVIKPSYCNSVETNTSSEEYEDSRNHFEDLDQVK